MTPNKLTARPLLTESEINELLSAHPALSSVLSATELSAGRSGAALSSSRGSGMEFDDLRQYQTGEDPRQIDWRASARSQQTLVRSHLAELQQPIFILVDRGASMRFGTLLRLKVTQAARLAITLMGLYHRGAYEVGGLLLNPQVQWRSATTQFDALRQFATDTVAPCPPIDAQSHNWGRLLALLNEQLPPGSRLILLSDFFDLDESAQAPLDSLAGRVSITAVRILDPLEQHLAPLEGVALNWGETSQEPQTTAQIAQLQRTLERENSVLKQRFSRAGVHLTELLSHAESFGDDWLRRLM